MATLSTVYVSNLPQTIDIDGTEQFLTIDGSKLKLVQANLLSSIPTIAKTDDIIRLSTDIDILSSKIENFSNDDLNNIHTIVQGSSANWNEVYTHVQNESANWIGGGSDVHELSGNWQSTYNIVKGNSAYWDVTYSTVNDGYYNWNEMYDYVYPSGGKNRWDNVYTHVQSQSSNWGSTKAVEYIDSDYIIKSTDNQKTLVYNNYNSITAYITPEINVDNFSLGFIQLGSGTIELALSSTYTSATLIATNNIKYSIGSGTTINVKRLEDNTFFVSPVFFYLVQ